MNCCYVQNVYVDRRNDSFGLWFISSKALSSGVSEFGACGFQQFRGSPVEFYAFSGLEL